MMITNRTLLGLGMACLVFQACAGSTTQQPPATPPTAATPAGASASATADATIVHSDTPLLPKPVTSFGATAHDGWLYVLGGYFGQPHAYSKEGQSGSLYRMAISGGQDWERLAGVEPLQSVALVAHGDAIIRVGGMRATNSAGEPSRLQSLTEVARYRPGADSWEALPDLPEGRSSHDAVVHDQTLYVIGGWHISAAGEKRTWHTTGVRLDLTADQPQWQTFEVPFQRRALALATAAGQVIAIGGMSSQGEQSKRVDIYDQSTNTWRRGPDYPAPAFGLAAIGMGDSVYASGMDGTVYQLTIGDQAWKPVSTLAFPRFFHRLVPAGNDQLLAVGGILGMNRGARVRPIERIATGARAGGTHITKWTLTTPGPAKNRQGIFLRENTLHVFGGNKSRGQHDFDAEFFLDNAHKLHLGSLTWSKMAPYPVRRQTMQTVLSDDDLYGISVGGFGHDGKVARTHSESFVYDFEEDMWQPRPGTLPVPRSQFGLVRYQDQLWVFGGLDYDPTRPKKDQFRHLKPVLKASATDVNIAFQDSGVALLRPRRAFGGVLFEGRYYLIGGMKDNFQLVDTCDVYDFQSGTWTTIPSPRRTRLSPQLVALDGKLYLAGGSARNEVGEIEPDPSVEVFDPQTKTWSLLIDKLPIETPHMRMFPYRDRLLIYTAHTETNVAHILLIDPA